MPILILLEDINRICNYEKSVLYSPLRIASRYHSVMRPFYVRFMLFLRVVSKFMVCIRSNRGDEFGTKAKERLGKITGELTKLSSHSIISGNTPHYIEAQKLSNLCEQIQYV